MNVSVAIATYNGSKYISKQLDSIMNQSYLPDEIVISDDCSTDDTVKIIYSYAKKYNHITWKVIQSENNVGYIKNFLKAIQSTTEEIIILCDQDDLWDKDKIKFFKMCFETHKNMISLHTDYSIINKNGDILREREIHYLRYIHKYNVKQFCKRLNYCGMSSAFHKCIKDDLLSINPDMILTHDWTIHALSVLNNGMYISNKVTSYRRYHENNVALNFQKKVIRNGIIQRIDVIDNYIKYYILLDNLSKKFGKLDTDRDYYISKIIEINKNRIKYLSMRKIIKWIISIKNIIYYPSYRSYLCDFFYLCNIF